MKIKPSTLMVKLLPAQSTGGKKLRPGRRRFGAELGGSHSQTCSAAWTRSKCCRRLEVQDIAKSPQGSREQNIAKSPPDSQAPNIAKLTASLQDSQAQNSAKLPASLPDSQAQNIAKLPASQDCRVSHWKRSMSFDRSRAVHEQCRVSV